MHAWLGLRRSSHSVLPTNMGLVLIPVSMVTSLTSKQYWVPTVSVSIVTFSI